MQRKIAFTSKRNAHLTLHRLSVQCFQNVVSVFLELNLFGFACFPRIAPQSGNRERKCWGGVGPGPGMVIHPLIGLIHYGERGRDGCGDALTTSRVPSDLRSSPPPLIPLCPSMFTPGEIRLRNGCRYIFLHMHVRRDRFSNRYSSILIISNR